MFIPSLTMDRNVDATRNVIKSVSIVEKIEYKVHDLHDLGIGIAVRMNTINAKMRIIPMLERRTRTGLMKVSTIKGMLISPTVI